MWCSFYIPYLLSVFFPYKCKINFCFAFFCTIGYVLFPFETTFLSRRALFHHITPAVFFPYFHSRFYSLLDTFKALNTFPHMPVIIRQSKDGFTRTSLVSFTRHFIITNFHCGWSSHLWPKYIFYSHHFFYQKLAQFPSFCHFFF